MEILSPKEWQIKKVETDPHFKGTKNYSASDWYIDMKNYSEYIKDATLKNELIKFAEWFAKDSFELVSLSNAQKRAIKQDIERYIKTLN